jgi:hypothetical protein
MTYVLHSQGSWPTESQKLLLRATLGDGDVAADAWREWTVAHNIGSLDRGSDAILPTLYLNLKEQEIDIDDFIFAYLKRRYRLTWANNLIAKHALLKVSSLLEEANIKSMVPKGIPLVLFHYPDLGARSMGDVDLLIEPEDLSATATLLQDHEWTTGSQLHPPGLVPYFHAAHFYHPVMGCLDLHWTPFKIDSPVRAKREFWERTICKEVDGRTIRVPDDTDLLLQVFFHSRKVDSQTTCRWIVDAHRLINGPDNTVDWDALVRRSKEVNLVLPVCDALTYLHKEFGPVVRGDLLEHFHNLTVTRESRAAYFEQMRESAANRGIAELLLSQWRRYMGVRRSRKESASWLGFVRYYVQFLKWRWQTPSLTRLPRTAAERLLKRLRPSQKRSRHRG